MTKPHLLNAPRCRSMRRLNAVSVTEIMKTLQDGASTIKELAEASGLHEVTTRHYVLTLHREGVIHIAHWEQDKKGCYRTPAYILKRGNDAERPKSAKSDAVRSRERRKQVEMLRALAGTSTAFSTC